MKDRTGVEVEVVRERKMIGDGGEEFELRRWEKRRSESSKRMRRRRKRWLHRERLTTVKCKNRRAIWKAEACH